MTALVVGVLGQGLVDPGAPLLRADDMGVTRGDGCFETCRVQAVSGAARMDDIEAHLTRMAGSAAALELPFRAGDWSALAAQVADAWSRTARPGDEAALKLVLTRGPEDGPGPTAYAFVIPAPPGLSEARRNGIAVVTLTRGVRDDTFAGSPWLMGGVKSLSYVVNMAAQREAKRRGADDALFVTDEGKALEGTTSSLVWVNRSELRTVEVDGNGILRSITTERLLEAAPGAGLTAVRCHTSVEQLFSADAAMLVSSVRGPVRIRRLDDRDLPDTAAGRDVVALCQKLLGYDT